MENIKVSLTDITPCVIPLVSKKQFLCTAREVNTAVQAKRNTPGLGQLVRFHALPGNGGA